MEECFPFHGSKANDEREAWIAFNYRFNISGYLPYFIPTVANYFREQDDIKKRRQSTDLSLQKRIKAYSEDIEQYKRKLIRQKILTTTEMDQVNYFQAVSIAELSYFLIYTGMLKLNYHMCGLYFLKRF